MIYFIPAWYKQNQWCENEQIWYIRRMHSEFDDTVKQVQLFHRSGVYPYRLLLLGFSPNFRHFLHRQGVYHANYWSCFDAIQGVRRKKAAILSYHNLNWPAGIEFVYNPWSATAWQNGEKYAQIEFGEDGNPIQVDIYENGVLHRRNIYDDRGFVSATIVYKGKEPFYQDYLTENGVWKMRCFCKDGHVEINPQHTEYLLLCQEKEQICRFSKLVYETMEQVIEEVFCSFLNLTWEKDIFCVAMHERHEKLLGRALQKKRLFVSFFGNRYSFGGHTAEAGLLERADFMIADTKDHAERILREMPFAAKRIRHITPYDTRADEGISRRLSVQNILVPIDGLEEELLAELTRVLGQYLFSNQTVGVQFFSRKPKDDRTNRILELTGRYLEEAGYGQCFERFSLKQCVDELAVNRCMKEQRLLLDLTHAPELYLQVTAVSIGIPQIVRVETEFVRHGKNGIVLKEITSLQEALCYYLESLANWNKAQVAAYEISKKYTADQLMKAWKEVMDSIG